MNQKYVPNRLRDVGMRHVEWTRHGRKLELPTGERVYKALIGQQNVELCDGSFVPYLWNDDSRTLTYAGVEARFKKNSIEFWLNGTKHCTTFVRLQRRTHRGWVDEKSTTRIEKLRDEDELRSTSQARVAVVLESSKASVRHVIVAGCRQRARSDTHLVVSAPGEYRVVIEHDLLSKSFESDRSIGAVGYVSRSGWRVAWTSAEHVERKIDVIDNRLIVSLPSVRRSVGQRRLVEQFTSPDTYGPAVCAGGDDDSNSDSSAYNPDGNVSGTELGNGLFVDDLFEAERCVGLRFAGIDLDGTPGMIVSANLFNDRDNQLRGQDGPHMLRTKCQASNTPATGANASGEAGRPFGRTYLSSFSDNLILTDSGDVDMDVTAAVAGCIQEEYSYTGDPTHAIMFGIGANVWAGLTLTVSYAHVAWDSAHATGDPSELTIVYRSGVTGSTRTLYLTNDSTSSPSSSLLLKTTANSSESQIDPGEFDNTMPGLSHAGQWIPGITVGNTTVANEIDNPSSFSPIRGSTAPTATSSPSSPAETEIGDLVIVCTWSQGTTSFPTHSLQSGFTEIRTHQHNDGSTDGRASVAVTRATSSGVQSYQAYSVSGDTVTISGVIVVRGDVVNSDTVAAAMQAAANSSTITGTGASNPPAITIPDGTGALVFGIGCLHLSSAATVTMGAPAGFTLLWDVSGSGSSEMACVYSLTLGQGGRSIDPGTLSDNVTPNGSCAITLGVPLEFVPPASPTRRGFVINEQTLGEPLTGRTIAQGSWHARLRIYAPQGLGAAGKVCARVSVVEESSGEWITKKVLTPTKITGVSSPGLTLGQAGWCENMGTVDAGRITVTVSGSPENFDLSFPFATGHTFEENEELLIEFGFCDAHSNFDRTWRLLYNTDNSYVITPFLSDAAEAELEFVSIDPFGMLGFFGT